MDSVSWDFGDTSPFTDVLNPTHTYPAASTYNVWLYSFNECMTKSVFKTITITPIGFEEDRISSFTMYPNPADDKLVISNLEKDALIKVYNIVGEEVYMTKHVNKTTQIELDHLTTGSYFVKVQGKSSSITKKLIVRH